MKKNFLFVIMVSFLISSVGFAQKPAQKKVDEYGTDISSSEDMVEQVAPVTTKPKKAKAIEERTETKSSKPSAAKPAVSTSTQTPSPPASESYSNGPTAQDRAGRFRVGIIAPGIGVGNNGVGALFTAGAEGEYFFFEKLSASLRIEALTKFKDPTVISIVPRARYFFDFDRHPRFAIYVQAGVGVAVYRWGQTDAAADISIPGGGMWWQWTNRFSIGADTNFHVFVKGNTSVGFTFSPTARYAF